MAREADEAGMDFPQREDLSFPRSLPEFQRLFPDDAACAAYLEKARWGDGFVCPHCQTAAEPFRFTSRPGAFRSLLGIAGDVTAPTYAELYSGDWEHPRCSGCG